MVRKSCSGTTRNGNPCDASCISHIYEGAYYCYQHKPSRALRISSVKSRETKEDNDEESVTELVVNENDEDDDNEPKIKKEKEKKIRVRPKRIIQKPRSERIRKSHVRDIKKLLNQLGNKIDKLI